MSSTDVKQTAGNRRRQRKAGQTSTTSEAAQQVVLTKPYTYAERATNYARDVVAGRIDACLYVRQACQRHLGDLAAERKKDFAWRYDHHKANLWCRAIEQFPHIKGEWARKGIDGRRPRLKLEDWQCFLTCCLFGWVEKATGYRKYSEAYIEIPRKNAKTTWAAAVGLLMLVFDGEIGAEVYCGATTEKQAMEVFGTALKMARSSPEFLDYFGVNLGAKSIFRSEEGDKFVPLVGDPGDGASPSCGISDETHEQKNSALIDTLRTGMGARAQGLLINITTAGVNLAGPAYALRGILIKVLAGIDVDETFFGIIYTLDEGDDWKAEASLRKANPNYGVSVRIGFLQKELNKALRNAHLQTIFKTKHLNIWGGAAKGWMNLEAWRRCADPSLRLDQFLRKPCWEGLDLAARIDLASRAKLYKEAKHNAKTGQYENHYFYFGRHYVPKALAFDGEHEKYAEWVTSGHLEAHEGIEIQLPMIEAELVKEIPTANWQALAFDKAFAVQMQQRLTPLIHNGEEIVIDIPQTGPESTEPINEIEAAVLSGRFHHDGDPVMEWAISNVVVKPRGDFIVLSKERPENKIDPVSALVNAMNRAYTAPAYRPPQFRAIVL